MNFSLVKGKDFSETFDFKNAQGKPISLPAGTYRVVLEYGGFIREYTVANGGLSQMRTGIIWRIPQSDSASFEFSTMYYTLYVSEREITRGVLRIQ